MPTIPSPMCTLDIYSIPQYTTLRWRRLCAGCWTLLVGPPEASGLVSTAARAMLAAIDWVFDQSRRWLGVPGRAGLRAVTATMRYHPPRSRRKAWPARAASEAVISRVPFLRQYVKIAAGRDRAWSPSSRSARSGPSTSISSWNDTAPSSTSTTAATSMRWLAAAYAVNHAVAERAAWLAELVRCFDAAIVDSERRISRCPTA
jgi:hypothetical protein